MVLRITTTFQPALDYIIGLKDSLAGRPQCRPLRRIPACAFGVLALESEAVDPRL